MWAIESEFEILRKFAETGRSITICYAGETEEIDRNLFCF